MAIVKIGQAAHLGKWEVHSAMVRLVRDLVHKLEDGEELTSTEHDQIDNVLYAFLGQLPKKVQDEVHHG